MNSPVTVIAVDSVTAVGLSERFEINSPVAVFFAVDSVTAVGLSGRFEMNSRSLFSPSILSRQ